MRNYRVQRKDTGGAAQAGSKGTSCIGDTHGPHLPHCPLPGGLDSVTDSRVQLAITSRQGLCGIFWNYMGP